MPKQTTDDEIWEQRISAGEKYHDKWSNLFRAKYLEEYYEGHQWAEQTDQYVINQIYTSIQIKLDEFIPTFPKFQLTPEPGNSDFDLDTAVLSAQLKQDVLNTIIQNTNSYYQECIKASYKDHFFRFGVYEVGYSADWILNPNAPRALLDKDTSKDARNKNDVKIKHQPAVLPIHERVYFKHIPAKTFRIFGKDHIHLSQCDSYGYFEYVHKDDILALKKLLNRAKILTASTSSSKASEDGYESHEAQDLNLLKIWHIWDNKAQERLILLDDPCITIYVKTLDRQNVFDYRPDTRVTVDGFYPVPPVFHWLSSQNELNETREQLKKHRRRFTRKFQVMQGQIDDGELEKFESGDDGSLVQVKRENAITPIIDAPLGAALNTASVTSADDLNQISGISANDRQIADRTTATESNIIAQRANVRQVAERDRVAKWVCVGGREALLIVRDKFVLGVWAKLTTDSKETLLSEMQSNQAAYKFVTSEDLKDGYDFHIDIDLSSLSVSAQQEEKQAFMEFLAIIAQYPAIAMSPTLVREAAFRVGYRNEKVIKEMQKMALLQQAGAQAQIPGMQQGGNQSAQGITAQQTPNTMEQIRQQIGSQVGQKPQ